MKKIIIILFILFILLFIAYIYYSSEYICEKFTSTDDNTIEIANKVIFKYNGESYSNSDDLHKFIKNVLSLPNEQITTSSNSVNSVNNKPKIFSDSINNYIINTTNKTILNNCNKCISPWGTCENYNDDICESLEPIGFKKNTYSNLTLYELYKNNDFKDKIKIGDNELTSDQNIKLLAAIKKLNVSRYFIAEPHEYTMKKVSEKMTNTKQLNDDNSLDGAYIIPVILTYTSDFYTNPSFQKFAQKITENMDWYTSTDTGEHKLPVPFFNTTALKNENGYWNFNEATGGKGKIYCKNLDQLKAKHIDEKKDHGVNWVNNFDYKKYNNPLETFGKGSIFYLQSSDNKKIGRTDDTFKDGFGGIYIYKEWEEGYNLTEKNKYFIEHTHDINLIHWEKNNEGSYYTQFCKCDNRSGVYVWRSSSSSTGTSGGSHRQFISNFLGSTDKVVESFSSYFNNIFNSYNFTVIAYNEYKNIEGGGTRTHIPTIKTLIPNIIKQNPNITFLPPLTEEDTQYYMKATTEYTITNNLSNPINIGIGESSGILSPHKDSEYLQDKNNIIFTDETATNLKKIQKFTDNDKEFGHGNKTLLEYLFPTNLSGGYDRPEFMKTFTNAFKSFHISKNNKYCILQVTRECHNHYVNSYLQYVWRAGFHALLKTRFLPKNDSNKKTMIFLPIAYNATSTMTFAYYGDSPPVTSNSLTHQWGKSHYNNYNNSLGIIRLNTPLDIMTGPMSHELIHYYNNKAFKDDVFVNYRNYKSLNNYDIINYKAGDPHWGFSDINGQLGGFDRNNLLILQSPRSTEIQIIDQTEKNYNENGIIENIPKNHGIYTLKDWSQFSTKTGNNKSPGKYGLLELYSMNLITEEEFIKELYPTFNNNIHKIIDPLWANKPIIIIYKNVREIGIK